MKQVLFTLINWINLLFEILGSSKKFSTRFKRGNSIKIWFLIFDFRGFIGTLRTPLVESSFLHCRYWETAGVLSKLYQKVVHPTVLVLFIATGKVYVIYSIPKCTRTLTYSVK